MTNAAWIIALNTFTEARHNKVLHIAAAFAAVLILFSLFMGEVSLYQNEKVVKDVGLAAISVLGVFVAVFLGVNSLHRELQGRTIYSLMSKPLTRRDIMIGKFIGMILVLSAVVLMMTIYLYLVTSFMEARVDLALMPAIVLITVELYVVAALALFFSSFSSPFLSGIFTVGVFIVGRISHLLGQFGERSKNEIFKFIASMAQKVFDLEAFDLRSRVVHKLPVYYDDFWLPILYGVFLIALILVLSHLAFERRDFK